MDFTLASPVGVWECMNNGKVGLLAQSLKITIDNNGGFQFATQTNPSSPNAVCMDALYNNYGDYILSKKCISLDLGSQIFGLNDMGNAMFSLKVYPYYLGTNSQNFCVDISSDGSKVQSWQCNQSPAQSFSFDIGLATGNSPVSY